MRGHTVNSPARAAAFGIEVMVLGALVLLSWRVVNSEVVALQPELVGAAVLLDMTLTAALCHYLLGVRLGGLLAWTIIPVMVLGVITTRLLLPPHIGRGGVLPLAGAALVECSVLVLVMFRIRTIRRAFVEAKRGGAETFDALECGFLALAPSMPVLAAWARLELQLWSLFFVGWAFKPRPTRGSHQFTHHRQSHWFTILGVLLFLVLIEGALVHWWLHTSGHTVAKWILFAVHAYGVVWLVGDMQATRLYRSAIVTRNGEPILDVRIGLRGSAQVPLPHIGEVTVGSWNKAGEGEGEGLIALQGTANVKLSLAEPGSYKPVLGASRSVRALLLHVDEPDAFKRIVEHARREHELVATG